MREKDRDLRFVDQHAVVQFFLVLSWDAVKKYRRLEKKGVGVYVYTYIN